MPLTMARVGLACLCVVLLALAAPGLAGAQFDPEMRAQMMVTQGLSAYQGRVYGAAAAIFLEVIQMPEVSGGTRADAYLWRGMSLVKLGRTAEGKAAIQQAVATPGASDKVKEFGAMVLESLRH